MIFLWSHFRFQAIKSPLTVGKPVLSVYIWVMIMISQVGSLFICFLCWDWIDVPSSSLFSSFYLPVKKAEHTSARLSHPWSLPWDWRAYAPAYIFVPFCLEGRNLFKSEYDNHPIMFAHFSPVFVFGKHCTDALKKGFLHYAKKVDWLCSSVECLNHKQCLWENWRKVCFAGDRMVVWMSAAWVHAVTALQATLWILIINPCRGE